MKEIQLTRGQVAIVDDGDFDELSKYNWQAVKKGRVTYAGRNAIQGEKRGRIYMHRQILKTKSGIEVDHISGDGLDNRRSNLRECTHADNSRNRGANSNNACGYKGVFWVEHAKSWRARIKVNGKAIHIGYFKVLEDAARAYDATAKKYFGEFSGINFPA